MGALLPSLRLADRELGIPFGRANEILARTVGMLFHLRDFSRTPMPGRTAAFGRAQFPQGVDLRHVAVRPQPVRRRRFSIRFKSGHPVRCLP
jgi:hypothetical protein